MATTTTFNGKKVHQGMIKSQTTRAGDFIIAFIIFLTMLVILNIFVARNVTAGNEKYINDDLVTQKNNGLIYVKQMLVLNGRDNDEEGFAAIAPALVIALNSVDLPTLGSPTTPNFMIAAP